MLSKKAILSLALAGIEPSHFMPKTARTSKGRKRTVTAAQQKRAKVKRKNKAKN